jgi:nitrite reductase/ring-hydroxylating ferredoxin subunit
MSSDTLYEKRYVEVARTNEIEPGQLKHVEVEKKEIAKGKVVDSNIVCPFHAAKFNIPTGGMVNPAVMAPLPMDQLPPQIKSYYERVGPLMMSIKTYDQKTYGLKIEDGKILVAV